MGEGHEGNGDIGNASSPSVDDLKRGEGAQVLLCAAGGLSFNGMSQCGTAHSRCLMTACG